VRDGVVVTSVPLAVTENSNGVHEAELEPLAEPGRYEVKLRGKEADRLSAEDGNAAVSAGFRVVGSRGPVELAETTLNLGLLETVADLSGGKVVKVDQTGELTGLFLKEGDAKRELRETPLWDNALVLGLFALLLSVEWVMRRGGGLP
jgi:hypothetical protein